MKKLKPKFYLNRKLKPDLRNHYSVYLRFNLNGSNHRLKSQLIGYLVDDDLLKEYEELINLETKYINVLVNYCKELYQFVWYEQDIERLNMSLYNIYTSPRIDFYKMPLVIPLKERDTHINFLLNEYDEKSAEYYHSKEYEKYEVYFDNQKPSYEGNDNYRDELIQYLTSISDLEVKFYDFIITDKIFESRMNIANHFIKNKSILDYVNSCNDLLDYEKSEKLNIYKWIFEGKGEIFKEKYGESSYELINNYIIFECKDIFFTENIYDEIKSKK